MQSRVCKLDMCVAPPRHRVYFFALRHTLNTNLHLSRVPWHWLVQPLKYNTDVAVSRSVITSLINVLQRIYAWKVRPCIALPKFHGVPTCAHISWRLPSSLITGKKRIKYVGVVAFAFLCHICLGQLIIFLFNNIGIEEQVNE